MVTEPRNWRRTLFRTGLALVVIGYAPIAVYCVVDQFTGDPRNPGNPVGLGMLSFLVGGPGLLLLLIAAAIGGPRQE